MCQFCLFSYFESRAAHRHLHSFPTRRSSDLVTEQNHLLLERLERRLDGAAHLLPKHRVLDGVDGALVLDQRDQLDRKSTRLNSSHLVISYAVFCLKQQPRRCAQACRSTRGYV